MQVIQPISLSIPLSAALNIAQDINIHVDAVK